MAVEVLDYQGFSKLLREGDLDAAMAVHLPSMQNLISLLAKQQQQAKQEDCTLMADATLSGFKKLIGLIEGSGHARFRRAPVTTPSRISPSCPAPQGQRVLGLHDKSRSSSTLQDAAQISKQVFNIDVLPGTPNLSCSAFKRDDSVGASVDSMNVHAASPIIIDRQNGHVLEPPSLCSSSGKDGKVDGHASSLSMNGPHPMLCIASTNVPNLHIPQPNQLCSPCKEVSGDTPSRSHTLPLFEDQVHSGLHVSGHARCRDSTAQKLCHQFSTGALPQARKSMPCQLRHPFQSSAELDQAAYVPSKTNSSFMSSLSMEGGAGTLSNGRPVISSGRPPLPPKKRKSPEKTQERSVKCHNSGNCHCAKRRKLRTRRILRVSTVGLNNTDIPADGYSWGKYGQKLSKDSCQPRVYYKCSSVRGCPARKHVERDFDDPSTFIVTYGREHLHPPIHKVLMASE